MDWTILVIILQLIFLEGILSIDNAAVLGALVAPLPNDQPVPFPKSLQRVGSLLHPLLGSQRMAALRVGMLGAYAGRGLMLLLASFIVHNPWLKLLGAAYLIRLAFDSLGAGYAESQAEDSATRRVRTQSFWATVVTVELMDLAFSLDNVVAAVSLSDKLWVVVVGVFIGILTMRFAAGLFSRAVERFPVLKTAAYVLVLNIGVELVLEEVWGVHIGDLLRFAISAATILLALVYARFPFLHHLRPALVWFSQGFSILNELVDWLLAPLRALLGLIWRAARSMLARPQPPAA